MRNRLFIFLIVLLLLPISVKGATLSLFYGRECPHCAAEEKYLESLQKKMGDDLTINKYEVWHNQENGELLEKVMKELGEDSQGVPYTVIGDTGLLGYNANTEEQVEKLIKKKSANRDVVKEIKNGTYSKGGSSKKTTKSTTYKVPILGKISAKDVSLPLLAIVLGLIDGFNPCAMWVLLFLITMLIHNKKKRMLSLGLTFILTSGIIYALFMMAWLNIAVSAMQQIILRSIIAVIAIITGIINLRSYIKSRNNPNGCEVVDDKKRSKILKRIKEFTKEKSFALALIGVIGLACSVNLIELACSAGLPLLFTSVLAINNLSAFQYAIYIIIYIVFFLLDDIVVFLIAVKTAEVTGLSTKYSKYTHLIGGIIMFLIGILLLFKPEWIMLNF